MDSDHRQTVRSMSATQVFSDDADTTRLRSRPFRFYMGLYPRVFILGVVTLFLTDLLDCLYPLALKYVIDYLTKGEVGRPFLRMIAIFMALIVGASVFRFFWRYFFGQFQHQAAEDLRNRVYTKFSKLSARFYQTHPVGELMSLISNDVNTFRMAVGPGVLILLDSLFITCVTIPVMVGLSLDWTWKCLIFLPLLPPIVGRLEKLVHDRFKIQQDRFGELSGQAQEIVSGIRIIKSYAQENDMADHFNKTSKVYEQACNRSAQVDAAFHPTMAFAVATGSAILLWIGSPAVIRAQITLGTFYAFQRYIQKMMWPMSAIGFGTTMVQQGRASMDRISQLLGEPLDLPDTGSIDLESVESIEVRNLTFTYPGANQPALKDVSFRIQKGETLGIVGPVGSGKSTLAHLILHLYPLPKDTIFINGIEIHEVRLQSLREKIALVMQDSFLFGDTVADNISLGLQETAPIAVVDEFARIVNINAEIENLPDGYLSPLGERGVNLSGGQKQRLSIARALIRKTPAIILDDSLSAVDTQTARKILDALNIRQMEKGGKLSIIISHRLEILEQADRILVLNNGRLEAIGTARELVKASATYRELQRLQDSARSEYGSNEGILA